MNNSYLIKRDKEDLRIDQESIIQASHELNGGAYKLYIYLYLFGGTEIEFSTKRYIQYCGGGDASARRAIKELMDHNFLQQKDGFLSFCQSK